VSWVIELSCTRFVSPRQVWSNINLQHLWAGSQSSLFEINISTPMSLCNFETFSSNLRAQVPCGDKSMHSKVVKKNDPTDQSDNEFNRCTEPGTDFDHHYGRLRARLESRVWSFCSPREFSGLVIK